MVAALKVVRFLAVRVIYLNSINLMGLSCHQLNLVRLSCHQVDIEYGSSKLAPEQFS